MIELTSKSAEWMQFPYLRITISGHLQTWGDFIALSLFLEGFLCTHWVLKWMIFFFFLRKETGA